MSPIVLVVIAVLLVVALAVVLWIVLYRMPDKPYFCQSCGAPTYAISNLGMNREGHWRRCTVCGKDSRYDNVVP